MFKRIRHWLRAIVRPSGDAVAHQDADARRLQWIDSLRVDVRFALRYFARKPLSSVMIVVLLALGIGGESLQLSLFQTFTRRPPPGIPEDVPLVRVRGMSRSNGAPNWNDRQLWYAELRELAALPNTFTTLAGWTSNGVAASVPGVMDGDRLSAQFVTPDFFRVIGVRPTNGPGLPPTGVTSEPVGVISYAMWEDVFDRGDVAGRVVMLNEVAVRVAGVAPPGFTGPLPIGVRRMMWLPLSTRATVMGVSDTSAYVRPDLAPFEVVGRLAPGVSLQRATAAAHVVAARVAARMLPPSLRDARADFIVDADVVSLRGITSLSIDASLPLIVGVWTLLGMLVLAIVCTNVGGLVMSAGALRRHEIGVRLSLGASRGRLIRQLLTESILLAFAGAVLGLLLFRAGVAAASHLPETARIRPDLETVALTMLAAVGTAIIFGLTPALHATRQGVGEVLKDSGTGATRRSRLHQAFVVGQVVAGLPLLVLVGSMIAAMMVHDPPLPAGIPDHVLRLSVDTRAIPASDAQRLAAADRLTRRLGEMPGVVGVVADAELLRSATLLVRAEDRGPLARANDPVQVNMMISKPGYFGLLGVALLRGNDLAPTDSGLTVIIGSDLARALWGTADPIGRRFSQISPVQSAPRDLVVTGVYDADHLPSHWHSEYPRVYSAVKEWAAGNYLVRTQRPAVNLADTVRRITRDELPSVVVDRPTTLAQTDAALASDLNTSRQAAVGVATLVLLLSSIGLYGIVALSVGQRHREIGVRMALGAGAGQVVRMFYKSGLALGGLGLVVGLPIGLVAANLIPIVRAPTVTSDSRWPTLLLVGGSVAGVVLVVMSIATLIPSSRAATVDPVVALRTE